MITLFMTIAALLAGGIDSSEATMKGDRLLGSSGYADRSRFGRSAPIARESLAVCARDAVRMSIDLDSSVVKWRGTKFFGLGSHEGIVRLRAGAVCVRGGTVTGGAFLVDMRTIEVTDIPASDPVPRRRLREHLLSEDFFFVDRYPEATLTIDRVANENRSLHRVEGRLTIRGITHPVSFYARIWELTAARARAQTKLTLNRHRWSVSYRGSTIRDDLVDDDFTLELHLVAQAAR